MDHLSCDKASNQGGKDGFNELEFQPRSDGEFGDGSPSLWKTKSPASNVSGTRSRAIVDGRRQLMEMIQDLPESFYELSLRDIVDETQKHEHKEKTNDKPEPKVERYPGSRKLAMCASMERENLVIKTFIPSFSFRKKLKSRYGRKGSSSLSFDGYDKNFEVRRFLDAREGDKSFRSSCANCSCITNSNKSSRICCSSFSLNCWPFFFTKNSQLPRTKFQPIDFSTNCNRIRDRR